MVQYQVKSQLVNIRGHESYIDLLAINPMLISHLLSLLSKALDFFGSIDWTQRLIFPGREADPKPQITLIVSLLLIISPL